MTTIWTHNLDDINLMAEYKSNELKFQSRELHNLEKSKRTSYVREDNLFHQIYKKDIQEDIF